MFKTVSAKGLDSKTAVLREEDGQFVLYETARSRKPVAAVEYDDETGITWLMTAGMSLQFNNYGRGYWGAVQVIRQSLRNMADFQY